MARFRHLKESVWLLHPRISAVTLGEYCVFPHDSTICCDYLRIVLFLFLFYFYYINHLLVITTSYITYLVGDRLLSALDLLFQLVTSSGLHLLPSSSSPSPSLYTWNVSGRFPSVTAMASALRLSLLFRRSASSSRSADSSDTELARRWLQSLNAHSIPRHLGHISFSRSSGPGGQNVNKSVPIRSPPPLLSQ